MQNMSKCVLQGWTPLHDAIQHCGDKEHIVDALLTRADVDAKSTVVNLCFYHGLLNMTQNGMPVHRLQLQGFVIFAPGVSLIDACSCIDLLVADALRADAHSHFYHREA